MVCSECFRRAFKTIVSARAHCFGPWYNHRPLLHGLLSPRTATLELKADIVCIHCFRFRYVTNVNHCIVPKVFIVPRSTSMRSRLDNGKNVRRKRHSVAVRYCVNYNVSSPCSLGLWHNQSIWYNTMVYVSYIAETEAFTTNSICRKL